MATLEDVAQFAAELPDATAGERHGNLTWFVAGKAFAWDRPFSKADIKRFGTITPPEGPILAVRVAERISRKRKLSSPLPRRRSLPFRTLTDTPRFSSN